MELSELIKGRRYKFTVLGRGEEFTVEGTFLDIDQWWWQATPTEDDVTKSIIYKRDDEPGRWSLNAKRVLNIEPLDD
jgi:hypothetical protein